MGKYDPLGSYLKSRTTEEVLLTFGEIEAIIGCPLPESQKFAAWWSNNPTNNVMTRVWLAAGFETQRVDLAGRKLVFRKANCSFDQGLWSEPAASQPVEVAEASTAPFVEHKPKRSGPHPGWGALAGTITIPEGVDITAPLDEPWGQRWDDQNWLDDLK